MGRKQRLRRDIAGVGPEPRRTGLHPLSGLKDFRISKGEPDIRGWEVRTLNGREVGRVDDLLVDTDAGEVVMMDVEMRGSDRHIELPIRSAQIDQYASRVIVDSGDVDLYAGAAGETSGARSDRDERNIIDRGGAGDLDTDRVGDARASVARDVELEADHQAVHPRLRGRNAAALENEPLPAEVRSDADEVVVERRPVIEEVVIRRRGVDRD